MAITNYTELTTAVQSFMDRNDIAGDVPLFISLAEARLNRLLSIVETDVILTGVAGSRNIDVSTLSIVAPIVLKLIDFGDEYDFVVRPPGAFNDVDSTGKPGFWALDGDTIRMDRPLDQPYRFRFRYQGRFALSADVPTNKLLTDHPDVYLAASLVWGGAFVRDAQLAGPYKALLDEFIEETRTLLSRSKQSILTVDPMFTSAGRGRCGEGNYGSTGLGPLPDGYEYVIDDTEFVAG
ncbi:hypothetical protein J2Y63_002409 [Shinella sp. BE166]|uniref:phage adaptor protein n=1 Tax=Shinella sp. BE166 TaxID=3373918 RepID=UPI003EBDA6A0